MEKNVPQSSTSELLHPEHMSDESLRTILNERGAELGEEVGHWQLRELYDALVLPKPKLDLDPMRKTTQLLLDRRLEASAVESIAALERGTKRSRVEDNTEPQRKMKIPNGVNLNATVSVSTKLSCGKMKRSNDSVIPSASLVDEPPRKKRRSPIQFP